MLRPVVAIVAAGALAGVLIAGLEAAGYRAGWITGGCVAAAVILVSLAEHRLFPPARAPASPPNPDRAHWHYLQLALGAALMAFGLWRLQNDPRFIFGWLAFAAGAGLGLWAAARQRALALHMRTKPGLFDERARANRDRAERWALLAALETGLILGLLDLEGILSLSGAAVGFSVAFVAVETGLLGQAFLEWRDSREARK